MQKKRFISFITATVMIITALAGLATVTSFADDTETVYNFSELTVAPATGDTVLNDITVVSAAESISLLENTATITSPLGTAYNCTKGLKSKGLTVKLHVNAGETIVVYYAGSNSKGDLGSNISMAIQSPAGTSVATESNSESGTISPKTISYKATDAGDYTVTETAGKNRVVLYAIAVTTADYTGGGSVTPTTAPTTDPSATTDPNATATPTPTVKPTATPAATVDPETIPEIEITRAQGWLESAYVTWTSATAVDGYNVYVKPENGDTYTKIDDELVRYYGSYYRADALGLAAGTYIIKVAPVIAGAEKGAKESSVVTVEPNIREGFAFDSHSSHYNAAGVGAYKNDGTLKDGAKVVYITDANKDTVQFDVVTDAKGTVTHCTGLGEILAAREKNNAETTPLAIRMIGQVEAPKDINGSGYMQIKSTSNVTFEGVGEDATTYHWSFLVRYGENIEIRNLAVMEFYDDGISLDTENYNCWVHNCDIFYGQNRGGDQKKGDGSLDVKSGSDYCSFSYNHFWDSGKTSLCGMKDDSYKGYHMTYYGNWFDHSDSRHPRVRGDQVHVYNNYYDGVSKYGVGSCTGSSVYVEKNVFRNAVHPVLISGQGTDAQGDGTFSGEDGGVVKMYDNEIYGGISVIYASETNTNDFDAYLATTRDETVPETYAAKQGGSKYTNFDTASTMYSYTPLDTNKVVDTVKKYAGRVQNGDFTHTFDDAVDDALYDRDTVLGNALQDYKTTLKTEYTTAAAYPATSGTQPAEKDDPTPFDPTAQSTPKPNTGDGGGTGGGSSDTNTTTDMWRASDNGASIAVNTVLKDSWLTLVGGGVDYASSNKTISGVSLAGKVNAPKGQTAPTLAEKGLNGATLKFTPDKDGTIGVYFKLNSGKTFYIVDLEAETPLLSFENSTTANDYFYKTAAVTAGKTYYAFADGSNAEYWAAEYTTQSAYSDGGEDDNPGTGDEPGDDVEKCKKIVATYDGTRLVSLTITDAPVTEAKYTVTERTKTFYWKTLEGMEPVPDAQ